MRLLLLIFSFWVLIFLNPAYSVQQKQFVKKPKTATKKTVTKKTVVKKTMTRKVVIHKTMAKPRVYDVSQLSAELNRILRSVDSNADVGVYVKSMQQGKVLYAQNIHKTLVPASILKIFTAEAALLYLGPQYTFATQIYTDAKAVKQGVLQGNLYIALSGDPSLSYDDLVELMSRLKKYQIRAIAGNVYIDDTAFDKSFYGPGWISKDKNYCYAAPIGAGIVNRNCLSFKLTPAKVPGRFAQVLTSPKYFYPDIKNTVVTKAVKRNACYLKLNQESGSTISLAGCMPIGRYEWGVSYVIPDMPDYNRALFKALLAQQGVRVQGQTTFKPRPRNLSLVETHTSKPLQELISEMLKKSDNVIAGAIFKKIGQVYTRQSGSWENGSYAVAQILSRKAGMSTSGLRVLDGSGLSRNNLATPAHFMQILDFAYHHSATSRDFMTALPISGVDGTLKHRLENIPRKVLAKTGTMSGVVTLAGYTINADKESLAFVIMINGRNGMGWQYRDLEDKVVTALARHSRLG